MLMISLNDLRMKPCHAYNYLFRKYDRDGLFNVYEEAKSVSDLVWVFINCEKMQNSENLNIIKSMNPSANDIKEIIRWVRGYNTIEMFEYFKSLKPHYADVSELMMLEEDVYMTKENYDYYLSLEPCEDDMEQMTNYAYGY